MAIRVLVVDDSITVREAVIDALRADPSFEIIGQAEDGATAITACATLRPDVITMDVRMPRMSGVAATEAIMDRSPTPILVLTAATSRSEQLSSWDALAAGAVDVLEKPRGDASDDTWPARLASAVRVVSRVGVIRRPARSLPPIEPVPTASRRVLVAIGASTGGPAAVADLLAALPSGFSLPIAIVVHLSAGFETSLAEWLDERAPIPVRVARDGAAIPSHGVAFVAPGDKHLRVEGGRLRVFDGPERWSCRPSVDVLFESVAAEHGAGAIGVLLTGMGRDGAAGLLAMRRAGAATYAQDEATSAVFGMPAEAIRARAAAHVLPPRAIGQALADHARTMGGAAWRAS